MLPLLLSACAPTPPPARPADEPERVLWAWESPQDLRFLPADVGVAYLARTVYVREGRVDVLPRRQPLRVVEGAWRVAVVRVESGGVADAEQIAAAILEGSTDAEALQVDWDARRSERGLYRAVLERVRAGTALPLTITALASWCLDDRWLDGLPIDGAVPMYFRLGEPTTAPPKDPTCAGRLGVSTDEPWPFSLDGRQTWIFRPGPWTEPDFRSLP